MQKREAGKGGRWTGKRGEVLGLTGRDLVAYICACINVEVRMRMRWMTLLVCVLTGMMQAQELLPEVAGPAAKYKAAVEAVGKQKAEAVSKAAQSYVSALDGIEKSATAKGDVDLIAAVVKEREAAVAGTLEEELPATLPKARLYGTRKALQKNVEKIGEDFARKGKQADAEYLRALAGLQAKAAPGSDLAKQVAAEKAAVLAGGAGAGNGGNGEAKGKKVSRGKNVVVNGDFEKVDADGKLEGWACPMNLLLAKERENTFIRFEETTVKSDGAVSSRDVSQNIEIPKGAKTVTVSARLRTSGCSKCPVKKEPRVPSVVIIFRNQGKNVTDYVPACWREKNGDWETIQKEFSISKDTTDASVRVLNGRCSGQIDFDDVEVTFK